MEGLPDKKEESEKQKSSSILEEINSIQKGKSLDSLSVSELKTIKEKYLKLKQELGINIKVSDEGMETSYEQAQEIMGDSFYGTEEIKNAFGIEFPPDKIPSIQYSPEVLEEAKESDEFLILRFEYNGMTMLEMKAMMESRMDKDEEGKLFYDQDLYRDEAFFKEHSLKTEWKLVGKEFVPDSTGKNYIEQTKILRDYLIGLESLSEEEQKECTDDLLKELQDMLDKDWEKNWKEVAKRLSELLLNKNHRRTPAEIIYDWILQFRNRKERGILEKNWDWSNALSSDGKLVILGRADRNGVSVSHDYPDIRHGNLGVVSLR